MERVLAIDPGYERVGIAIFEGAHVLHSECFSPPSRAFDARLREIAEHIEELAQAYRPAALALETLFFSTNVKTASRVAEARGAIIVTAARLHMEIFEYSPQAVKIAVTSSGNANKHQVIAMVKRLVPLQEAIRYDDEYDALALGICHQAHSRLQR